MAEKIFVSFVGWCECDPDKVNFVYLGMDKSVKEYITGREWLLLTECEDEGTIGPYRDDYMLESCADAQATALECEYEDIHVEVE
jgi:hypothetical protein